MRRPPPALVPPFLLAVCVAASGKLLLVAIWLIPQTVEGLQRLRRPAHHGSPLLLAAFAALTVTFPLRYISEGLGGWSLMGHTFGLFSWLGIDDGAITGPRSWQVSGGGGFLLAAAASRPGQVVVLAEALSLILLMLMSIAASILRARPVTPLLALPVVAAPCALIAGFWALGGVWMTVGTAWAVRSNARWRTRAALLVPLCWIRTTHSIGLLPWLGWYGVDLRWGAGSMIAVLSAGVALQAERRPRAAPADNRAAAYL